MLEALKAIPIVDAHTHLTGGQLTARGLHDVLLYHMIISELYAAGCPSGERLTEWPNQPTLQEAESRITEAIPFLPRILNTSCYWLFRMAARDLYDWNDQLTVANWRRLDDQIRERADDRGWQQQILARCNVQRLTTELSRAAEEDANILDYSMEWAFFTRVQRGAFDTPLYELERVWGEPPGVPVAHGTTRRPEPSRTISTIRDVHDAMDYFVGELAKAPVVSLATHISTELSLQPVAEAKMRTALKRRAVAGPDEQEVYAAYLNELLLHHMVHLPRPIVFQFSFGAEPLPHETGSVAPQAAIRAVGDMVARHPGVRFVALLSSRHGNQAMATLSRELPNLTLAGYWWHNFFPGTIRQVMDERLDMLPMSRQIGFFSDAYSLEWTYSKAALIRQVLADVLALRIDRGQYSFQDAELVARQILAQTARNVYSMDGA
jgi:hypothetical protein